MAEKANPNNNNITKRVSKYTSSATNTAGHSLLSVLPKIDGIHSTQPSITSSTDSQSTAITPVTLTNLNQLNPNLLNINNVNHVNAAYVNLQPLGTIQSNTQDFASLLANNLTQNVMMQNLAVPAPIIPSVNNSMHTARGYSAHHLQTNKVSQQRYSPFQRVGVLNTTACNNGNVNNVNGQMDVSLVPNLDGTVSLHFKNIPLASALQILQQSMLVSKANN